MMGFKISMGCNLQEFSDLIVFFPLPKCIIRATVAAAGQTCFSQQKSHSGHGWPACVCYQLCKKDIFIFSNIWIIATCNNKSKIIKWYVSTKYLQGLAFFFCPWVTSKKIWLGSVCNLPQLSMLREKYLLLFTMQETVKLCERGLMSQ